MNGKRALRNALQYRVGATLAFLIGLGIAGLGLRVGDSAAFTAFIDSYPNWSVSRLTEFPVVAATMILGILVWQLGSAAAYMKATSEAVEEEMATRFDPERIKSDILSVLDDRLADTHEEVAATRRAVDELKRETAAERAGFESPEVQPADDDES